MIIDIVFAILAAYGFYLGFSKGIISTVFTILSYVFGLMAAFKFSPAVTQFLETSFSDHALMFIAGFLLTFVATMMLIRTLAKALESGLETANVNIINQLAGGFLLAAMLTLMYSSMLWFGDKARLIDPYTKMQSLTYPYLEQYPQEVWKAGKKLGPTFENFWNHSLDFFDKVQDMNLTRDETPPEIYDINEDDNNGNRQR